MTGTASRQRDLHCMQHTRNAAQRVLPTSLHHVCLRRLAGMSLLKDKTLQNALVRTAEMWYKKQSTCLDPTERLELH